MLAIVNQTDLESHPEAAERQSIRYRKPLRLAVFVLFDFAPESQIVRAAE